MNLIVKMHEQGKTIIVITHDMDLVNEYAQKVFMLENGKLAFEGTPSELFIHVQNYDRLDIPKTIKLALAIKEKGMDIDINQIRSIDDLVNCIKGWRNKA